ncbi:hypothetical protein E3N88_36848 [Mikania micrantha]|uniref:DUF4283 domain-containing protein n=1 Tax=Mikania micrantha TaxID=192012 RepID=A0A5N6M5E8_9ASTR|nr:hypothetical protein E3N88_36848 [Mikania micrantha]
MDAGESPEETTGELQFQQKGGNIILRRKPTRRDSSSMLRRLNANDFLYTGGLKSLISFNETYLAREFIQNSRPSWNNVFRSVALWEGQELTVERIVSLNIHGVPLLDRDETTYNKIGEKFGRVLISSEFSWSDEDVSYGKVHILALGGERIDEKISLSCRNNEYPVLVTEDLTTWIPTIDDSPEEDEEEEFMKSIVSSWKNILKVQVDLSHLDNWIGLGALKDRFPFLFSIELNKRCVVKDRLPPLPGLDFSWAWKLQNASALDPSQINICRSSIPPITFNPIVQDS